MKGRPKLGKHNKTPQPHRQGLPGLRFVDPGKTPLGPVRIIGEGTTARVGKESRNIRRAREREQRGR